jgi:hypothetical protein
MIESEITPKYIGFQKSDLTSNEIEAIDTFLHDIAKWNATVGVDSNKFEREYVTMKIKALELKIQIISEQFYKQITI